MGRTTLLARPLGPGLALSLMLGCGGVSATGSVSATASVSGTTGGSSASGTRGATPPSAPLAFTRDSRDVLPPPALDERSGARASLVSQQPFSSPLAAMAVSGDGHFVLTADGRGAIALVAADTGQVRGARAVPMRAGQTIRVAIDGRATRGLVVLSDATGSEIYTWDLVTDALDRRGGETRFGAEVALSPAGDVVLALDADGTLVAIDAQSGEPRSIATTRGRPHAIGFTQGLGRAFVAIEDDGVRVHLLGDDDVRTEIRASDEVAFGRRVAFRPGGGQVAVVDAGGAIALCSPIDGGCPSRIPWPEHAIAELHYGVGGGCLRAVDDAGNQAFVDTSNGAFVATLVHADPMPLVIGACDEALIPRAGGRFDRVPLRTNAASQTLVHPGVDAIELHAGDEPTLTASSSDGRTLAVAYGGVLTLTTLPAMSGTAVDLVGVPGVVTDVLWTPGSDELYVRRPGEVLRVSRERVRAAPCAGDRAGRMLHDGSVSFDRDACSIRSRRIDFEVEGEVIATAEGENPSILTREPDGSVVRVDRTGTRTVLWPAARVECRPGPNCRAEAFMSRDGAFAVVRIASAVRVFAVASSEVKVAIETDPADVLALSADRRSLLVAHAAGGLEAHDLARGAARVLVPSGTVVLEADVEVDRYVVLDTPTATPRFVDAITNRAITVPAPGSTSLATGRAVALHDDLFLVGTVPHQLVDAGRGRFVRTEGVVLDAVRAGDAVVAAICQADTLQLLRFEGAEGVRVGSLGGCSRMNKVAIRPDGGAVAVAIADAALVLRLGANQPPLVLRTQLDRQGHSMPIVASAAGPFDVSDEAAATLRMRRAGPLNAAVLDPAQGNVQRQLGVQESFFATARGVR